MYVHNLDPIIFSIGPIAIRWYGLVYVLGFIGLYFGLRKLADMSEKDTDSLLLWLLLGMFIGARSFFFTFYRPELFTISEFFSVWNGGMSFHGALAGMLLSGWLWAKHNNKDFWKLADITALLVGWFLALGRVANFINAEILGTASNASWCVQFSTDDVCRHPVQLYSAIKDILLGSIILGVYRSASYTSGFIFWCFAWTYSVFRFIVNFWRVDVTYAFGWLKMGHILSLALFVVATGVLAYKYRFDLRKFVKEVFSY
jgi:phosphatidylglycerol:prolipoprotein diacylglycerol transferase